MSIPQKETTLMRLCIEGYDEPPVEVLRWMVPELGVKGTAERLGVDNSTVDNWLKYFGLRIVKVAVPKGYEVVVHPAPATRARALEVVC